MKRAPLGGTDGEWRYRVLRFHLPIGVASVAILFVFMTLPTFDPQAYPQMDMSAGSVLPERAGQGATMAHGASPTPAAGHDGSAAPSRAGHGGSQGASPTPHGAGQTPVPSQGHQASPTTHAGAQRGTATPDGTNDQRGRRLFEQRLTVATGYLATGLLGLTLLIGPANVLLRRRNPVSTYLRRDLGMWTAAISVVHVIYGSLLHSGGELAAFFRYFTTPDGSPLLNSFGIGNWTGLAATVIVLGLLAISNDLALRTLKAGRWKWLQRLNYALFALVLAHAFFYGALLRTASPFTLLLVMTVIALLAGQLAGIWLWRRRYARRSAT